jgi:hypothetical protein
MIPLSFTLPLTVRTFYDVTTLQAYDSLFASDQPSPKEEIFVGLVDKCVLAGEAGDGDVDGWLQRNDLNPLCHGEGEGADVYVVDPQLQGVCGAAWEFLRRFLERHDSTPVNNYAFHKCVANRILSYAATASNGADQADDATDDRMQLPAWLVTNFKERYGGALLNLFIDHRQYEDAINLVQYFVDEFKGRRETGALMPYTAIRRLDATLNALGDPWTGKIDFVHAYDH